MINCTENENDNGKIITWISTQTKLDAERERETIIQNSVSQ